MDVLRVPLFPLQTVLFPDGPLALRIFEPRYLDMVSQCTKHDAPFGVCLIQSGQEAGQAAQPYEIGTLAKIVDWDQLPDGLLGITAEGGERFSINSRSVKPNQLTEAKITLIPNDPLQPLPDRYASLATLLMELIKQVGPPYVELESNFEDAGWVANRLAELLPITNESKQFLLEMSSPLDRLEKIHQTIKHINQT